MVHYAGGIVQIGKKPGQAARPCDTSAKEPSWTPASERYGRGARLREGQKAPLTPFGPPQGRDPVAENEKFGFGEVA